MLQDKNTKDIAQKYLDNRDVEEYLKKFAIYDDIIGKTAFDREIDFKRFKIELLCTRDF